MSREATPRRLVMKKSGTYRCGKGTHSEETREEQRRRCEFLQSEIESETHEETIVFYSREQSFEDLPQGPRM